MCFVWSIWYRLSQKKTWCQKQKFLSCEILLTFPTHRTSKSKWGFPVSRHQNQTALGALLGCEYFQTKPTALKESFFGCAVGSLWVFQASVLILTNMDLAVYFWMPKKAGPFIHGKCRVCLQLSCWVGFLGKHLQCGANNLTCSTQNHHPHQNKSTQSTSHLAFGMLHKNIPAARKLRL